MPLSLDPPAGAAAGPPAAPPPKNLTEAAKQFEALLIGQLLKSAHGGDDDQGWLGTGDDTGDATAAGLAEQQFAQALAAKGGLGLSGRIVASLTPASPTPASPTPVLTPASPSPGAPMPASSQSPTLRAVLPSGVHR